MLTKLSLDFGSTRKLLNELKANKVFIKRIPELMMPGDSAGFYIPNFSQKMVKYFGKNLDVDNTTRYLVNTLPKSKGGNIVIKRRNPFRTYDLTSRDILFHEAGHALDPTQNKFLGVLKRYINGYKQSLGNTEQRIEQTIIAQKVNGELAANANALQRIPDKLKSTYMDKVAPSFKIVTDQAKEEYSKIKIASSANKLLRSYKQSKLHIDLLSKLINESGNLANSQTPNYFGPQNLERLKQMAKRTQQMEAFRDELTRRAVFPKVNNIPIDEFPKN